MVATLFFQFKGEGRTSVEAAEQAWLLSCTANFTIGLIEIIGAAIGELKRQYVPKIALLTAIGGIGFVFLALNPFIEIAKDPLISLVPLMMIFCWFFAGVDNKIISMPIIALLVGTISGWVTGLQTMQGVLDSFDQWGVVELRFTLWSNITNIGFIVDYLNIIIPIGIANFVETIENVESACMSGDEYDTTTTMVIDGLGTLIGASCGSCFPTTV